MMLPLLVLGIVSFPRCHDASESGAVGLSTCHRYAEAWDSDPWTPAVVTDLAVSGGVESLALDRQPLALQTCADAKKRSCTAAGQLAAGALGDTRLTVGLVAVSATLLRVGPFFLAMNAAWGFAPGWSAPVSAPELLSARASTPETMSLGGALGAELRLGRFSGRLELAPGFTSVSADVSAGNQRLYRDQASLEARASVSWWLLPGMAVVVGGGVDLLSVDRFTVSLALRVGLAPFGGVDPLG